MVAEPNKHAVLPGLDRDDHLPAGECAYEMTQTRLGSSWTYCRKAAVMRCTISHGGTPRVEDYCMQHYRNAMRRTRFDRVLSSDPIEAS